MTLNVMSPKAFLNILMPMVLGCALAAQAESGSTHLSKYGVLLPLTGNGADQGQWCKQGLELARSRLDASGTKVQLLYEDTHGDPKTAVSAFQALSSSESLDGMFTWGSGVAMALSPLTNAKKIIQMGIATATPAYSSVGDFTFRVFPSASDEALFLASTIETKFPSSRIGAIFIQNDYGVGTFEALKQQLALQRRDFLASISYKAGDSDFRPLLLRLKQANPEIIFLAVYPSDGALLLKQARQLGIASKFIASVAIAGGQDFFSIAGDSSDGLLVSASIPNLKHEFFQAYKNQFGESSIILQLYAARAFDALNVLQQARNSCAASETSCVKNYLLQLRNFDGASGNISFDEAGDSKFLFQLYQVEKQKLVVYRG